VLGGPRRHAPCVRATHHPQPPDDTGEVLIVFLVFGTRAGNGESRNSDVAAEGRHRNIGGIVAKRIILSLVMALAMTGVVVAVGPSAAQAAATCTGYSHFDANVRGELHASTIGKFTGQWECDLAPGSRGIAVVVLQEALSYCHGKYLGPSGVDGSFGNYTRNAVASTARDINTFYGRNFPTDGKYYAGMARYVAWQRFMPNGGPRLPGDCGHIFGPMR
jgi:hypothetical protein